MVHISSSHLIQEQLNFHSQVFFFLPANFFCWQLCLLSTPLPSLTQWIISSFRWFRTFFLSFFSVTFSGFIVWKLFAQILFYFLIYFCKQSCSLPCTCRSAWNELYVLHSSISSKFFLAAYGQVKVYWNDWWERKERTTVSLILSYPLPACSSLLKWCLQWKVLVLLTNCSRYWDTLPMPGPSPPPPASAQDKETGWKGTASGKHASLEATAKRKEQSLSQASRVTVGHVLNSFL